MQPRPALRGNIAFLHIPKTAGSSLLEFIQCNVGARQLIRHYPPATIPRPREYTTPKVYIGHFYYGQENAFFPQCERVTFLRQPVSRGISQLYYDRRYFLSSTRPAEQPYRDWFIEHPDDADIHRFPHISRLTYFDNAMVRMISGAQVAFGELNEHHLQLAMDNLEQFDFIGLQESFAADIQALAKRYDWMPLVSSANQGDKKTNLGPQGMQAIAELNRLDQQLYQHAIQLRATRSRPDAAD